MRFRGFFKGSVAFALPLLLQAAVLGATTSPFIPSGMMPPQSQGQEQGSLEGSWMLLSVNRDPLNVASAQVSAATGQSFPGTSASAMQLWGSGAMVQAGNIRYGLMGLTGGMSSSEGANTSNWGLDLAGLEVDQVYSSSSVQVLAGFFVGVGQFDVEYHSPDSYDRFQSQFIASGATAGIHWPATSKLSFIWRSGYLWLPAAGSWQGPVANNIATTYFDLSAPFTQAAIEISF